MNIQRRIIMGYFYLLCVAVMFSFGGTCVKLIKPYFGPGYITFFRFVIGIGFLLLLRCFRRQDIRNGPRTGPWGKTLAGWILLGAVAKWLAYLTENFALAQGPSYGNIVVQPAQTVSLTLFSVFFLKEKLSRRKLFFIFLCVSGVLLISWNGRSLDSFFQENALLTVLFLCTGLFAATHILAQKMVADRMNIIDSNLTIFAVSGALAAVPLVPGTLAGSLAGVQPDLPCILALLFFGFITGIGFYLNAKAIPLVPFYMVGTIQSMMVIFAIMWGVVFLHETVTLYVIGGTVVFMAGLIGLQIG
ncbi:MAG: DMT family transporter [Lachnospiraceae bacterium]|nr:DMT family transporter [Lachnospiraceae bacterium]